MKKLLLLTCMTLTLASCEKDPDLGQLDTNMVVYTDHDSETDFSKYQTYFLPDSILETGSHHATYWKDENAQKLIKAVESEMNSRGYRRITDPEQKSEADLGVQLSYIAQRVNVTSGWWGGWWDYDYWGPWWGGWYYPYTVSYSYDTNSLVMEMVDLTGNKKEDSQLPVVWYAHSSGYQYNANYNIQLMTEAIDQAFEQSPYIQSNK
jgi:hypothetical protein